MLPRKIFSLVLVVVCWTNIVTAYAARSSTVEELKYALQCSLSSLLKTDNYLSFVQTSKFNYNDALLQLKICATEAATLQAIRSQKVVGGRESLTCLAHTYLIIE